MRTFKVGVYSECLKILSNFIVMIYKLYIDFIKDHLFTYILYILTFLYIPLNKVGLPHYYGKLISIIKKKNMDEIKNIFLVLIFIWSVYQFLNLVSSRIGSYLQPKFISYIRKYIINEVIERHKNNYEDLKLGEILTKIINSPYILYDVFQTIRNFLFTNIIFIVSTFIYLFYHNKLLGCVYLLCISFVIGICIIYTKTCESKVIISESIYDYTHEEIEDTLSNIISVYTSNKTIDEKDRLGEFSYKTSQAEQELNKCNNNFKIIYSITFIIIFIVLNLLSFKLYLNNTYKIGTLISVVIINYSILTTLMTIYYDTRFFIDTKGRLDILQGFMDRLPKKDNQKYDDNIIEKANKLDNISIFIQNLTFGYTDKNIFKNLNLEFKPNETTAIIGGIGSGKSTIAKLIIRLKNYQYGKILLNDIEINKIPIDNLRGIIGYIPQHPKLFNRTLYENITYGINGKITETQIFDILETNEINDIIPDFKRLMNQKVGKNGSLLSGGQRQIVWLLRFLFNNHKIIILDEPTSSLDNKNKEKVIKLIKELEKTKTIIIITHDKELLKYVKRIIEFNKGEIIDDKRIKT
jgi:ABC-type multidrug transport system fused ATPase/permease subunit